MPSRTTRVCSPTCPDRVDCEVCGKKLCHAHEPHVRGSTSQFSDGHYITSTGVACMACHAQGYGLTTPRPG